MLQKCWLSHCTTARTPKFQNFKVLTWKKKKKPTRYDIPFKWLKFKNGPYQVLFRMWRNCNSNILLVGMYMYKHSENVCQFLEKFVCVCVCVCVCARARARAFSRASPTAYGGFQARGLIRAVATSLRQSHSNKGCKPHLGPIPQLTVTPDP